MGDAEVRLFQSWVERLATADEPLDVWYEQIWAPDIDHRAIEGPLTTSAIVGRDAMRAYLADWYEMFPISQSWLMRSTMPGMGG